MGQLYEAFVKFTPVPTAIFHCKLIFKLLFSKFVLTIYIKLKAFFRWPASGRETTAHAVKKLNFSFKLLSVCWCVCYLLHWSLNQIFVVHASILCTCTHVHTPEVLCTRACVGTETYTVGVSRRAPYQSHSDVW